MSINPFKIRYKCDICIKILSLDIGGVCTLPRVRVLKTFRLSTSTILLNLKLINVHSHLHLHYNNQYGVHLPPYSTSLAPLQGAFNQHNFLHVYHRLPNLKYSYLGISHDMLSIGMVSTQVFSGNILC